jgi:hypothetical protein
VSEVPVAARAPHLGAKHPETAWGKGAQKLGQPVPLSNFVFDENSGFAQPAHAYRPARFS